MLEIFWFDGVSVCRQKIRGAWIGSVINGLEIKLRKPAVKPEPA
jgi:hypothetical protein